MAPSGGPKRVILRLRSHEFSGRDSSEYNEAIIAYLLFAGRPANELAENKHFAHIEPFQDPTLPQKSFHITLDIEKDKLNAPDFESLPHEVYRVRRDKTGHFQVNPIQNPLEAENFLAKMRQHTDKMYLWAK